MRSRQSPAADALEARQAASHLPTGIVLLDVDQLAAALGISRRLIWNLAAKAEAGVDCGGFPRPVRLSARVVRWRQSDVERYLDQLQGASR